jgi:hypothetical protein
MIRAWLQRWLCWEIIDVIDTQAEELELLRKAYADLLASTDKRFADMRLVIATQREEARKPAGVARSFREIQSFIGEPDA